MDSNSLIQKIKDEGPCRLLVMEHETISFLYIDNGRLIKNSELPLGSERIIRDFFKRDVPSEAEVEYAINFIEDELMSDKDLINGGEKLYLPGEMTTLLNLREEKDESLSRQTVEEIFTTYALVSMGRSPVYDSVDMNRENYAKLLVLREILHHLNFEDLRFIEG